MCAASGVQLCPANCCLLLCHAVVCCVVCTVRQSARKMNLPRVNLLLRELEEMSGGVLLDCQGSSIWLYRYLRPCVSEWEV